MVDLVTAGMSSDSFFSYLRDAVGSLSDDLATLVYYPISIPTGTALGTLNINFNLLDYTLGQTAPDLNALAEASQSSSAWRPGANRRTGSATGRLDRDGSGRPQVVPLASTPRCWVWRKCCQACSPTLG